MTGPDPLVVAGGGPVGLVTALAARRAGFAVVVVEPRAAPIDKPCGEGIMPAGLAALHALGVDPPGATLTGITYAARGRRAHAPFRRGPGRGVRRTDLHAALHAASLESGAIVLRDKMVGLEPGTDRVEILLRSGQRLRAGWLVGADGLHSRVRTHVSPRTLRPRRLRRFGFVAHLPRAAGTDEVTVHWGERGEAYVTPLAGELTGLAVLARVGTAPGDVLAGLPELAGLLGCDAPVFARAAGPFLHLPTRRVRGRVLLVGDAAGYVDALTGEGLSVGFAQAHALVRALARGEPAAYERAWWRVSALPLGLAAGLVGATSLAPARRGIVPAAALWPGAFGAVVAAVAGSSDLPVAPIRVRVS